MYRKLTKLIAFVAILSLPTLAPAEVVDVTVTIENLAPTNSVSFAPLRVGFHNGLFDAFDFNEAPTAAIISIAEGGSGNAWFPAFEAADPTAVLGSVVNGGPAIPVGNAGEGNMLNSSASSTFRVDTDVSRFFTFATMVVPSNDLFLGNDNRFELFDAGGNLLVNSVTKKGADIWNAGSEIAILENGAFVVGGNSDNRVAEFGAVEFSFSELEVFEGAETAAGYIFDNSLIDSFTNVYRITFSLDPAVLLGDVNLDGIVSLLDVAPFVDLISNGGFQAEADLNQDGVVDLLDIQLFVIALQN